MVGGKKGEEGKLHHLQSFAWGRAMQPKGKRKEGGSEEREEGREERSEGGRGRQVAVKLDLTSCLQIIQSSSSEFWIIRICP